jgi:hypothetical protein
MAALRFAALSRALRKVRGWTPRTTGVDRAHPIPEHYRLALHTVDAWDTPTNTLVAAEAVAFVPSARVPVGPSTQTFTFATPPTIDKDTIYALVLSRVRDTSVRPVPTPPPSALRRTAACSGAANFGAHTASVGSRLVQTFSASVGGQLVAVEIMLDKVADSGPHATVLGWWGTTDGCAGEAFTSAGDAGSFSAEIGNDTGARLLFQAFVSP